MLHMSKGANFARKLSARFEVDDAMPRDDEQLLPTARSSSSTRLSGNHSLETLPSSRSPDLPGRLLQFRTEAVRLVRNRALRTFLTARLRGCRSRGINH
jgi:hypothetical protein